MCPTVDGHSFTYAPIGLIRSPHRVAKETPVQPVFARGIKGALEVLPEYEEGLRDLVGFSHIHIIYAFHRSSSPQLVVTPYLDTQLRGVFSTRAPCRPNAIGLSLVRLVGREGSVLEIEDVDVLDGTPLLDIKPYVRRFDERRSARCGWQDSIDQADAERRGLREYPGGSDGSAA